MKKLVLTLLALCLMAPVAMAAKKSKVKQHENPFLKEYTTKYKIPPFSEIQYSDYMPAFKAGIEEQNAELRAIVVNRARPDFDNTILAFDNSGAILSRVNAVYNALSESDNTPEMEAISNEAMPLLTAHSDAILLNDELFQKIKAVYDSADELGLTLPQRRLTEKIYKRFAQNGALLNAEQKEQLKELNQKLSAIELSYNSNILKETNAIEVVVDKAEDLAGIPQNVVDNAAAEAVKRGKPGKWVFTVHAAVRLAVLSSADCRDLRRRMYEAYTNLAGGDNQYNNFKNINEMLTLRTQKARLLGFDNYADLKLARVMAKTTEAAENLLYQIWHPAVAKVHEEVADMQAYAKAHGENITIEPWDYYYYIEKVKAEKFNFSEDAVRPYFQLNNVVKGIFTMAERLYGIKFTEMPNAPKYHPEVRVYDVTDAQGKHVAVYMNDYLTRDTKRQGAWMSELLDQCNYKGVEDRPIIYNVCNFGHPTKDTPTLLSLDEVETVFHEFGHALQGMLSNVEFRGISGTSVDRNAVEFSSQIHENWKFDPELLAVYARHYKTGEVIPKELVDKILESEKYGMGFTTTELCGAALLDLEWHKLNFATNIDVAAFEKSVARRLGLPKELTFRYRSPYFKHIFGGDGYSAGYYTYLWAEVLSSDGFSLFEEKGVLDNATAKSLLDNIISTGDSDDAMVLYKRFRGREPKVDALLKGRGL
mgnify:FL=1